MGITRAGRKEGIQTGRKEVTAGSSEFGGIKKMGKVIGGDPSSQEKPQHIT